MEATLPTLTLAVMTGATTGELRFTIPLAGLSADLSDRPTPGTPTVVEEATGASALAPPAATLTPATTAATTGTAMTRALVTTTGDVPKLVCLIHYSIVVLTLVC